MTITKDSTENSSAVLPNKTNFFKLITDIAVLTAVISAVGYYIGWTGIAGYYLTFGLSPNFIKKSVSDVLASAWLELFVGLAGIAIAIAVFQGLVAWLDEDKLADLHFQRKVMAWFYTSLVLSIIFFIISLTLIRNFASFVFSPRGTLAISILFMASALLLFLTASTIGKQFQLSKQYSKRYPRMARFFKRIYPNYQIYFGILETI